MHPFGSVCLALDNQHIAGSHPFSSAQTQEVLSKGCSSLQLHFYPAYILCLSISSSHHHDIIIIHSSTLHVLSLPLRLFAKTDFNSTSSSSFLTTSAFIASANVGDTAVTGIVLKSSNRPCCCRKSEVITFLTTRKSGT